MQLSSALTLTSDSFLAASSGLLFSKYSSNYFNSLSKALLLNVITSRNMLLNSLELLSVSLTSLEAVSFMI